MNFDEIRKKYFPFETGSGIKVRAVDRPTVYKVTGKIAAQVFTDNQEVGLMPFDPAPAHLRKALQRHTEQFVFYNEADEAIGWSIGEQREDDTFIMLWSGILRAYQSRGIYSDFLKRFVSYLGELGYAKVVSNHMVNNRPVLIAKLKAGFIITGMAVDERIGAVVWLTYFIDQARSTGFRRAFSLPHFGSS